MRAIALSMVAAVLVQPIVFWAWFLLPALFYGASVSVGDVLEMASYVLVVAFAFVVVLGLPIFLVLRKLDRVSIGALAICGFLAGALPYALYTWPANLTSGFSSGGNWHGRYVHFVVNGSITKYGWLNYAEGIAMFGVHGLIGALIFLSVWRRFGSRRVTLNDA